MDLDKYQELSGRTAAHLDSVRTDMYEKHASLVRDCVDLIINGQQADAMKRSLFYKEPVAKTTDRLKGFAVENERHYNVIDLIIHSLSHNPQLTTKQIDVIHSALGMMSEAAEILEEVVNSFIEDRPLNDVNLKEEGGDNLWYTAMLFRTVGGKFSTEAQNNINKLAVRYPDKFTEENALNRDLKEEEKTLRA